ncbi:MAG: outer membrane protein assembly factor BamD [Candidatus Cyclobacteriaceae bacterium M3_2C_046]
MWKKINLYILLGFVVALLAGSCSEFRKIQKSDDWKKKYEAALKYYEEEDYYHASLLFEEILPLIIGTQEAEKVQYLFAYSHYYQGNRLLSAHYFKTFYDTYRRSQYAEEALFMYAYSLYQESPKYNLDQTSTREAIDAIQNFINRYPLSEYKDEANSIIDQLQQKLEKKAYEKAKQYYKLENYRLDNLKAAIVAFDNFRQDFPDSHYNEEVSYLIIEAQYKLAERSYRNRQKERYLKTKEYYEYFIDNYTDSKYVKEAEKIFVQTLEALEEFRNNGTQTSRNN